MDRGLRVAGHLRLLLLLWLLFLLLPSCNPWNPWTHLPAGALGRAQGGAGAENLIANGGFERAAGLPRAESSGQRPAGWSELWARQPGAGQAVLDASTRHAGKHAVRIEHRGARDWSFHCEKRVPVRAGDLLTLQAWLKVRGPGVATLGAAAYDARGKVRSWVVGGRTVRGPTDWVRLRSRFVVPDGVAAVLPRLIGHGPVTLWVDEVSLVRKGNVMAMRPKDLPKTLTLENAALTVTLHTADATLSVVDRRTGRRWRQRPLVRQGLLRTAKADKHIEMTWHDLASELDVRVKVALDGKRAELTLTCSAKGEMPGEISFPHPFAGDAGTYLVVPMNEGISYPVEDKTIRPRTLVAYGGHGICMAFWGVTDGRRGHMAILETPDDAAIRMARIDGRLCVAPVWQAQKGRFAYPRRLRYVFFDDGGHVAIAKRYRAYAKRIGRLKTLAEKRKANPNVDRLVGAVNVWCWDRNAVATVRQMQSLGIRRILWSHRQPPEALRQLNAIDGVLTSRYDIYQDLMDPQVVKTQLRGLHPDWTQEGFPKDIMLDERGRPRKGWRVRGKDGGMYPCAVLCDRQAPAYARRRISAELKTHPYRCRFIDTTTASPWRECYHPDHPMTRGESRQAKMRLLELVSKEMRLVTGSETGHDAAAGYVHYFEGMLSLGPYRVPDAGRRMQQIWEDVPQRVAKFQVGWRYRLPLWELVYHDCVVAQWYWGDYNNKLPAVWDQRDLFNALYGTGPMFMFNRQIWRKYRERFVRSYQATCPVARAVGYAEMTDHRFLRPDRSVQQSRFANGVTVTVNFSDKPFRLPKGPEVAPLGCHVSGME